MGSAEKFCLRWNDFESNISIAFRELREDKDFFDVTLACDDEQIQAHKVIISACSPFFRSILRRNRHEHPLLYLKGVKYKDLVSVLNFMYQGEVSVAQEELNSFLSVAEDLKVKGLTQNSTNSENTKRPRIPPAEPAAPRHRPPTHPLPAPSYSHTESDIQEVVPVKSEPVSMHPPEILSTAAQAEQEQSYTAVEHMGGGMGEYGEDYQEYGDYEQADGGYDGVGIRGVGQDGNRDLDNLIAQSMSLNVDELGSRLWTCHVCRKTNKDKQDMKRHMEKHFPGFEHPCPHCDKLSKSRDALRKHISSYHK